MQVRRFEPSDAEELTDLLHRAYRELGAAGLNFTAVDQDVATTLRRTVGGASWVVESSEGALVATVTVSLPPGRAVQALTEQARVPGRAWLNQLAVDPDRRSQGLAGLMRETAVGWARGQGCGSIGLDTAEQAGHLVRMYRGWGFAPMDLVQWPGKTYRSLVLARDL